jgi:hypothetical protein
VIRKEAVQEAKGSRTNRAISGRILARNFQQLLDMHATKNDDLITQVPFGSLRFRQEPNDA